MNCPHCGKEMKKGTAQIALMGGTFVMFSYVPDKTEEISEEKPKKGFFKNISKSNTVEKSIMNLTKTESYYCSDCNILMPLIIK